MAWRRRQAVAAWAAALPAAMAALRVGGGGALSPQRGAAPAPAPRELPTAAMGAARVVALMGTGAADADVVRGAEALIELTGGRNGMKADRAAVLRGQGVDIDARCDDCVEAVPVLVRALQACGADAASVFCAALRNIAVSEAGRVACVAAVAPRAVVAALTTHAAVAAVC